MIYALASVMAQIWTPALAVFEWTTWIFAVLERTGAVSKLLSTWDPRNLPLVRDPHQISPSSALFESALTVVLVVWWIARMRSASGSYRQVMADHQALTRRKCETLQRTRTRTRQEEAATQPAATVFATITSVNSANC